MLAFDIIAKVIQDDKKKKQNQTLGSTETTKSLSVGSKENFVPTTLWTAISIGTDYAVGQHMYGDRAKNTSEHVGVESSWGESILATIGGELLGGLVSSMLLPSSIKDFRVVSSSADSGLAQMVKGAHSLACAYHGYKRHNDSILWGLGWAMVGNAGLAVSQHFAKPLATRNPMGMNYVRDIDHSLGSDAIENPRRKKRKSSSKAKRKTSRKSKRVSRANPKKVASKKVKATSKIKATHKRSTHKTRHSRKARK